MTNATTRTDDIDPIAIAEELEELLCWPGNGDLRVTGTWVQPNEPGERAIVIVRDAQFPWAADAGAVASFLQGYDGMTGEEYRDAYDADLCDDPYQALCSDVDELGVVDGDGPDVPLLVELYRDEGVVLTSGGSEILSEALLAVLAADDGEVAKLVAEELGIDAERVRVEPQDPARHTPAYGEPAAAAYVQGLAGDLVDDTVEVWVSSAPFGRSESVTITLHAEKATRGAA